MSTYSGYDDEPRRYRNVRVRQRERGDPDYMREETYIERGKGSGPRGAELVYRGRDDSIEDIPRDFPPPGRGARRSTYDDYDAPRRSKSTGGRRGDCGDDDRYTDYGGAARYSNRDRGSRRDDRSYYSDDSRSPPRRRDDRKNSSSGLGGILDTLGIAGIVGGLTGDKGKGKDKDRDRSRSRSRSRGGRSRRGYSSSRSRSRSRGGNKNERKWAQAAQAALIAGAVEAFMARKEPGPWTGEKGKRIATAALGAGGIDGLLDKNPDEKSKRHLATAVLGGVAASKLANGSRANSRGREYDDGRSEYSPDRRPRSRSRSVLDRLRGRSKSRGRPASEDGKNVKSGGAGTAVTGLLGAGVVAAAGKALYNKARSKSRKRRSPSNSSTDSYVPSRTRRRDRRRSPGSGTGDTRRTDAASDRGGQDGQDDRALTRGGNRNQNTAMVAGGNAANKGGNNNNNENEKKNDDDTDSASTTDMEKRRKHMKGREIITAALATVATIHAAHGVYSSMEAHEKRHKLVAEGEMSHEEARKKQTKAFIQDAAAVGIAALGIKGAFSEWKEMNEQRREVQELEKKKSDCRKRRLKKAKQEERDRHERMMRIMERSPHLAVGYQMNHNFQPGPPPQPDLSGNPYAPQQQAGQVGGGGGPQRY